MNRQQNIGVFWAHRLAQGVLATVMAAPLSAFALVGGAGADANTVDSPWAGVGSLTVGGNSFTGTLIAPGYVLTAAHVAAGADLSSISFQTHAGATQSYAASEVFINPGYTGTTSGNASGDPTWHSDLAIIRLSGTVASDVPFYSLFSGNLQSKILTFVSYGGSDTVKQTGENVADLLFTGTSGSKETYAFDYDGSDLTSNYLGSGTLGANREASLVGGDSGSSAFVKVNGQWQLAGINTFQGYFSAGQTSGQYGTAGGGVVLSTYASWINSIVVTPVPEPEGWLMLLPGLGLLGGVLRRRQRLG